MHQEGQDSARQAALGWDEAADHHNNQDDADVEGGARRQGLEQTMHGRRRKVYWVSARIGGEWVECFHNRPSIPNPSTESYSNGKTRDVFDVKVTGSRVPSDKVAIAGSVDPRKATIFTMLSFSSGLWARVSGR